MKLLGKETPPLGMGCWAIGGPFYSGDVPLGYANVDDATSSKTIHAALEAGIRIFDAAAVYGAGHAERLLGEALKGRDEAIVMTKLGTSFDENSKQMLEDDIDPANIETAIDASLKRLQRDYIDVIQLHLNGLSIELALPLFEQMERVRQNGKVKAYGWSTDFPTNAIAMAKMEGFLGVQHAMNVFADVPEIQKAVKDNNIIAFIRSPLAMGILTGKFNVNTVVAKDDVRSVDSVKRDYFRNGKVASKHLKNLDAIRELLQTGGRTLSQGALGWLMAKSNRNIPLPGARTPEQVQENAGAITHGPLRLEVMNEIELLMDRDVETEPQAR